MLTFEYLIFDCCGVSKSGYLIAAVGRHRPAPLRDYDSDLGSEDSRRRRLEMLQECVIRRSNGNFAGFPVMPLKIA